MYNNKNNNETGIKDTAPAHHLYEFNEKRTWADRHPFITYLIFVFIGFFIILPIFSEMSIKEGGILDHIFSFLDNGGAVLGIIAIMGLIGLLDLVDKIKKKKIR